MKVSEAVTLLDNTVAGISTNRESHVLLVTAIKTITEALAPKEVKKK